MCFDIFDTHADDKLKNDDKYRAELGDKIRNVVSDNMSAASSFQQDVITGPIVNIVSLLPKEELPLLAESLVALTSLKRHVSHDTETVGGPVDVALISKGDGFIWIKRKHYFDMELNQQFARNYMRRDGVGK